jgi:hypothetical protein
MHCIKTWYHVYREMTVANARSVHIARTHGQYGVGREPAVGLVHRRLYEGTVPGN